ncbi:related to paracaspase [Desulfotalea psychrophila LSv54]|uniref:Related to paracaspase n=1 Tax=Desulfotalea psychrophila (strain LSv54 / DSM 12343) TaxID=177439 RepID=Q6ANY3_DESPS|nr:related to paracaspase [Desulfotalea psychrophila LSv54]
MSGNMLKSLCLLVTIFFCSVALPGLAAERVALVIGNGAYKDAPLTNPVNDADDMVALLKGLGFKVIKVINADKREMLTALGKFSRELPSSEIGLFYFAGHDIQINTRNYLLPVVTTPVNAVLAVQARALPRWMHPRLPLLPMQRVPVQWQQTGPAETVSLPSICSPPLRLPVLISKGSLTGRGWG